MINNNKNDAPMSAADSMEHDDSRSHDDNSAEAGSTEAGIVRGVSRSVAQRAVAARTAGRSMAKLPSVGRLPRSAPRHVAATTTATKSARLVPVKRVARLTDRVSTGWDLWDTAAASSSGEETATTQKKTSTKLYERYAQPIARATTFATSLVKNTVLGAIVFESYCWMVAHADELLLKIPTASASLPEDDDKVDKLQTSSRNVDDTTISLVPSIYRDVFETTPVISHYMAGAVAGSLQGIGGSVWDASALRLTAYRGTNNVTPPTPSLQQTLLRSTMQHAIAHSILFGSYESCKRLLLKVIFSDTDEGGFDRDSYDNDNALLQQQQPVASLLPHQRLEFFAGVSVAGGLAGQFQHVASHILEQQQQQAHKTGHVFSRWSALPSLRSTLWAFPPSAIAFLAFEYGKDSVVELAAGEDDD